MPPLSTKKQERLNQLLSVLEDGAVQPNELIEAVEAVMAILDMSHKDVLARLEEIKKGATNEVQALADAVDQANRQIANVISQVREQGDMTAAEIKALVAAEVRRLEESMPQMPEMPEGYDDEEIREHIAAHKQILDNLSFLITGENVRNALEVLPEGEKLAISAIEGLEDALAKREQVRENTTALIVSRLDQISDVNIAGVTNGQVLAYNSTTKRWEAITASGTGDMTAAVYDPAAKAEQVLTIGDRTGADAEVVSGTAGTSGNLSKWDANGDLVDTVIKEVRVVNQLSSGLISGGQLSINANPALFDISDGNGVIVDNTTDPEAPVIYNVSWTGLTAQTVTNLATQTVTHVYITNTGAVFQASTAPTPTERRQYIYLGQLGHTNNTSIGAAIPSPDLFVSPVAQIRDLEQSLGVISTGNIVTANGANLSINKSVGTLFSNGINFFNDDTNPSNKTYAAQTPVSMRLRTQTGNGSTTTTLDVANYDVAGTITAIGATKAQNIRVYLTTGGNVVVQYGQTLYNNLAAAAAGLQGETFVRFPNLGENSILIGIISAMSNATDLSLATDAKFFTVSKFGEVGGAAAGVSVSTLQNVYDNSTSPEIVTNATLGAVTVKRGSAADTDTVMEVQNAAGTVTQSVTGNGAIFSAALTASEITATDASKNIVSLPVATYPSLTELTYVKGTTSAIQTQLDARLTNNVTSEASSATPTATGDRGRNIHFVTALAANTVLQVPSGTPALGNMAKYSILNGGTIRTCDIHASVTDPYDFFASALSIPASGRLDALMEYNGTAWVVISATVTV